MFFFESCYCFPMTRGDESMTGAECYWRLSLFSDLIEENFLMAELKGWHVTLFIGKSHVSREMIGLCEWFDKWSTAYGASRTTEGWVWVCYHHPLLIFSHPASHISRLNSVRRDRYTQVPWGWKFFHPPSFCDSFSFLVLLIKNGNFTLR